MLPTSFKGGITKGEKDLLVEQQKQRGYAYDVAIETVRSDIKGVKLDIEKLKYGEALVDRDIQQFKLEGKYLDLQVAQIDLESKHLDVDISRERLQQKQDLLSFEQVKTELSRAKLLQDANRMILELEAGEQELREMTDLNYLQYSEYNPQLLSGL